MLQFSALSNKHVLGEEKIDANPLSVKLNSGRLRIPMDPIPPFLGYCIMYDYQGKMLHEKYLRSRVQRALHAKTIAIKLLMQ